MIKNCNLCEDPLPGEYELKSCASCREKLRKQTADRKLVKRERGECRNCDQKIVPPSKVYCPFHLEKSNRANRENQERRVAKGLCASCSQPICPDSIRYCQKHLDKFSKKQEGYREQHKERGECQYCHEPVDPGSKSRCTFHMEDNRNRINKQFEERMALGLCVRCSNETTKALMTNSKHYCLEHYIGSKLRKGGEDPAWWETLEAVFIMQEGRCYLYGLQGNEGCAGMIEHGVNAELEHAVPKSHADYAKMDERERLANLMWACESCNRRKGDLTAEEFAQVLKQQPGLPGMKDEPRAADIQSEVLQSVGEQRAH